MDDFQVEMIVLLSWSYYFVPQLPQRYNGHIEGKKVAQISGSMTPINTNETQKMKYGSSVALPQPQIIEGLFLKNEKSTNSHKLSANC